jgi:hypothetical protein
MYLVDTNIFLELLLEQNKAEEVREFFKKNKASTLYVTEFTIYSIGIALLRLKKPAIFRRWIDDIIKSDINVVGLEINELKSLINISSNFRLDFDDACQYAIAEKYNLKIISFDSDFDRTTRKRKNLSEVLR